MSKKRDQQGAGTGRSGRGIGGPRQGADGFEALEARQLLSADLPVGGHWLEWGEARVAALQSSYVVTFDEALGLDAAAVTAREVATRLGVEAFDFRGIARGWAATFATNGNIGAERARRVAAEVPLVRSIEPDQLYQTTAVPNDPQFPGQYSLDNQGQVINGRLGTVGADISAREAWDITTGSTGVVVAVIDTGIDLDHPDLAPNLWRNPGEIPGNGLDDDGNGFRDDIFGFDFGDFDSTPDDDSSDFHHGTAVAGVIGAKGNNGIGISGVAWDVSLMALKIADRFGRLSTAAIVGAHDYATLMLEDFGINVVASNNSYGAFQPAFFETEANVTNAERDAIARFIAAGGIFVAAAGNEGNDNDDFFTSYPASYNVPGVISVAASDNNDGIAGFSSFGAETVDLAAPGVAVLTTASGGGYQFVNGTSFSAPTVAGAIALIKSFKPNASAVEIREALINSADPLPAFQNKTRAGGRLNVARALEIIGIEGPTLRSATPGPVVGQVNPATGQPYATVELSFSRDIDPSFLAPNRVTLQRSGANDAFEPGDPTIPVLSVVRSATDPRTVVITLDTTGLVQARLPVDTYRLTLDDAGFKSTGGSFLNGNAASGADETYDFRVAAVSGDTEPNDAMGEATPIAFNASGQADFTGVTLGNGLQANLDVDLYRIVLPRGALITAETFAKRLPAPSTLDTVLRLFDSSGVELASNDQFFSQDSFVDFFVSSGGTYYIGVSGFGNEDYNPFVAGSGTTQSLGVYNLRVGVQLANDDVVAFSGTTNAQPGQPAFPLNIPRGDEPNPPVQTQGVTTAALVIADTREILDVNVRFDLAHTFDSDLRISLISPAGTEVLLVNRRGGEGDNFTNTLMDDEAVNAIAAGVAPFNAGYRPEQGLGFFDGQRANGIWTLRINDTTALNSGRLNGWSLEFTFQNNIFGPFESNDTIASARPLSEFTGTGSASRTAFLGDGGFGGLDRDIYSFVANPGTTLTADVAPALSAGGAGLNSLLRLFDSAGNEILISNPGDSLSSRFGGFVFAAGGTYYIAVSEASNAAYNPGAVNDGTGVTAATTGTYTLSLTLSPGVSDPALVLAGNDVSMGLNTGGTLSGPNATGLRFQGIEFLPATGLRQTFIGGVASGFDFSNSGVNPAGGTALAFSLVDSSDSANRTASATTSFRGLSIRRTFSFAANDDFVAVDVYLTNDTQASLADVAWMEGFNPDQGLSLGQGASTLNDVSASGRRASAGVITNQFPAGVTVALAAPAADTRARANVIASDANIRDPAQLLALPVNDPQGAPSDSQLALGFDVGDLAPGQSTRLRYFIFFGNSPAAVDALEAQMNANSAPGFLAANPATPATETLSDGSVVPQLPFKVYYPEGFLNSGIFTFIPIANPNAEASRVVVIARYEFGGRDQVLGELTIPGNSRSGLTVLTPETFENVPAERRQVPFSIEVRSERPVAATFSYYDLNLVGGTPAAVGESFTSRTDTTWTFGGVRKGPGIRNFVVFANTADAVGKADITFFSGANASPVTVTVDLGAFRRGGVDVGGLAQLPDGEYGVRVAATVPIVASLSAFSDAERTASGVVGVPGVGSTVGIAPEGLFGRAAESESVSVLNTTGTTAAVTFSFLFSNGGAYRTTLAVPAGRERSLQVEDLSNFPTDRPYSVTFESNVAVSMLARSNAYGEAVSGSTADRAYSLWSFGEGFRPGDDNPTHPGVTEYLRLYTPSTADQTVEITIAYDGVPGFEVFRRTIGGRRVTEVDVHELVTGSRRATQQYFSITVKAPTPIVAYFGHFDRAFPGAFGTLGTPFGQSIPLT